MGKEVPEWSRAAWRAERWFAEWILALKSKSKSMMSVSSDEHCAVRRLVVLVAVKSKRKEWNWKVKSKLYQFSSSVITSFVAIVKFRWVMFGFRQWMLFRHTKRSTWWLTVGPFLILLFFVSRIRVFFVRQGSPIPHTKYDIRIWELHLTDLSILKR